MHTRRKILVIDDDPVIREMLRGFLEKAGYEVVLADNGKSGLEAAQCENPDLVITDGLLPKMHGFLVCKAIKDFDPPPKVIILTGLYTKPSYRWNVKRDYGADDLLGKPIEPAHLIACVKKHLGEAATSELPDGDTQVDRAENADERQIKPDSAKFSDSEMEEIFDDWSIPA